LILAKYTCVALQRLNGSAKKVKGSFLDKSIRLNMESLVFLKLQEVIEHPCRSREWFALAEQAIHTVYALGDQLEVLSNTLIKNLSRRAFRPREKPEPSAAEEQVSSAVPDADAMDKDLPPSAQGLILTVPGSTQGALTGNAAKKSDDTGDAFEVSQLLFVVGHVAVKHIVYLELVEREWKRQKQEKEVGMCLRCMNGWLFCASSHILVAEKLARGTGNDGASKDEELDQVAGNAEYEIGDRSVYAVGPTT
jgi:condensin complex subunit 1